jgi:hypothetical protein
MFESVDKNVGLPVPTWKEIQVIFAVALSLPVALLDSRSTWLDRNFLGFAGLCLMGGFVALLLQIRRPEDDI